MRRKVVHTRKSFTEEDEIILDRYRREGLTCMEIAEKMGRTLASIKGKLQRIHIYGKMNDRERKLLLEIRRQRMKKRSDEPRRMILDNGSNSGITEFWESALRACNVEIKLVEGYRTFFMNGSPVSIFTILRLSGKE